MEVLRGKTVFITGASAGIGEACALRFAAAGARLLLAARRQERLRTLQSRLQSAGAEEVAALTLDVRNQKQVQQAIEALPAPWQTIDILINNAGLSRGLDKLHEGSITDWEEMIDTNVKGLLYVTRAITPGMVARGRGHVVNIGSTAGRVTYPGGAVYCATKAAENRISEGLRMDLLGTPIRVTSVDPGMVETEFSRVRFHGDERRAAAVYAGMTPLTAEDVAEAVLWATSRPAHVNVAEILLTGIDQANSILVHRKSPAKDDHR
jgi:3-hydroxy acid dehydrogenase/malonic semialdehyde reductase